MKKLLILFTAIALISCDKDEDLTLSQAEQEIENAKLVGTWQGVGEYNEHSLIIAESFEMTIIYPNGKEVRCKYHLNKGMIVLDEGEYFDWGQVLHYYMGRSDSFLGISNAKNVRYDDRYWLRVME